MIQSRAVPILFLLLSLVHLPACEPREAGEVRDTWRQFSDAIAAGDGKSAVALLTPRVLSHYDRLLEAAKTAGREQLKEFPPVDRAEIIRMRHRVPGDLRKMDGKAYLTHAIGQGWYAPEPGDRAPRLGKITFKGDAASVEILIRDQPSGYSYDYRLINDMWHVDTPPVDPFYNEKMARAVEAEHSTEDNLIMRWESQATGIQLKHSVWDPPR